MLLFIYQIFIIIVLPLRGDLVLPLRRSESFSWEKLEVIQNKKIENKSVSVLHYKFIYYQQNVSSNGDMLFLF